MLLAAIRFLFLDVIGMQTSTEMEQSEIEVDSFACTYSVARVS